MNNMKFGPPLSRHDHLGFFRISNEILDKLVFFVGDDYTNAILSEVFGKVIILSATREKNYTVYFGRSEWFEASDISMIPLYKLTILVENKTKSQINMETGDTSLQKCLKSDVYTAKFEKVVM